PLRLPGQTPLCLRQPWLFGTEEARVLNVQPITGHGEAVQANVDANRGAGSRKGAIVDLAGEGHVPLASAGASDTAGLDRALDGPMQRDTYLSHLGQLHCLSPRAIARPRVAEAIIAMLATKSRVSRFLT